MPKKQLKFKDMYKRLEEISETLDLDDIDVEEGLKLVEEANRVHKKLSEILDKAKLKVSKKS